MSQVPGGEAARPTSAEVSFEPGQVIGGRFQIENKVGEDGIGLVLAAKDQRTQKPVMLRVLSSGLFATPDANDVLRAEIRAASAAAHRHLATTYGTGNDRGARFVATEWPGKQSLAARIEGRKQKNVPFGVVEVVDLLSQISDGLSALHAKGMSHGALRPATVYIGDAPKIADVGLSRALVRTTQGKPLGAAETLFLAPEVRAGAEPTPQADVFGMGGLLYALLTLKRPDEAFSPPSKAHPECKPAVDQLLLRSLAPDPSQRPADLGAFMAALRDATSGTVSDASLEVDVDVDIPLSVRPPADLPASPARPAAPRRPNAGPAIGDRVSIHEEFRASLPNAPPPASALVDLSSLLKAVTENDAPRWMVQKDGLDHGPFSARELIEQIAKGEVRGEHALSNMDTGERKPVVEYPQFVEFAEQNRLKRQEQAERDAIVRSTKSEKASNAAKFLVGAGVVAAVALIAGAYLYTRGAEQRAEIANAGLADLYERGQVDIEGTAGILPDPPRPTSGHRAGGARPRPVGGGSGSYEEAMSQVVEMGDVTAGGGEARLSPQQVAGVMNRSLNSLFSCVGQELRTGRAPGRVRIDIAIAGSGQVLGSSVRAGSADFQRCVQGRVAAIHFPSFSAPRMGASFSFDAQ